MASLELRHSARTVSALILICTLSSIFGAQAAAEEVPTSEIRALLHLNGSADLAANLGHVIAKGIIAELRRTNPGLPERADRIVTNTVDAYIRERSSHGEVIDLLVPIYAKYLTKSDVEELIAFYKSPVGRRLATVTPEISADSTIAGQQWATSVAAGLQQRLTEVLRNEKLVQ